MSAETVVQAYHTLALVIYLGAVAAASAACLAQGVLDGSVGRALRSRWFRVALIACGGALLFSTLVAALGHRGGLVSADLFGGIVQQWLFLLLAAAAAPWGVGHDARVLAARREKPRRSLRGACLRGAATTILFSCAYFVAAGRLGFDSDAGDVLKDATANTTAFAAFVPVALLAPFFEEVFFRLAIQGTLERVLGSTGWRLATAIGVTSAVWALGHASNLATPGVKEGHILLLGVFLGALRLRYGVVSTIFCHLSLNGLVLLAAGWTFASA